MTSSDRAIDAIYAAGVDRAGWQEAIGQIGTEFHAVTGAFYIECHSQGPTILDTGVMFGHDDAHIASYSEHFGALNPFNRVELRRDDIGVLSDTEFDRRFGSNRFANSEYCVDWAGSQFVHHVVGQRLRSTNDTVLCTAFWRPADVGPYSLAETVEFGRLMRHINRAIDVGARLRAAEAELKVAVEFGAAAVITVGRDGRVGLCNALAEALLSDGRALVLDRGRLRTVFAEAPAALDRMIAHAFDPRLFAWAEHARLSLPRKDEGPPLTLKIISVAHRLGPFMAERAVSAMITVEGYTAVSKSAAEHLSRRFGLTPAQTRLALALQSGKTLQEAALDLGVAVETARSHLKALFARTGTRRQAELLLLLRSLDK